MDLLVLIVDRFALKVRIDLLIWFACYGIDFDLRLCFALLLLFIWVADLMFIVVGFNCVD